MRILFIDIDTLRPDHMGCYGYGRNTTPNLDEVAREGVRFENYYCSDAPCLPSRAALISGMFGIRNGAVGHGGTAADRRLTGAARDFQDAADTQNLTHIFRRAGLHTVSFSTFAERHSSYWFQAGFQEAYNVGKCGNERAEEVVPLALDWLERNRSRSDWYMHLHLWDPHTPYRAPLSFGDPFQEDPLPAWITPEVLKTHIHHTGPHSISEINMFTDEENPAFPRHPGSAHDMQGLRRVIDGYDTGIAYADAQLGRVFDLLREQGIYDEVNIIVTSDHGENLGELGLYSEHATADHPTCRIPMLIKWKGAQRGAVDRGLHYSLDLCPTVAELLQVEKSESWDGISYAPALLQGREAGRPYLVLSQMAHVCQRSVRFGDWLYMRTYHDGFHLFPREMLYNIAEDPHEQHNLADERPELCDHAARLYLQWHDEAMMRTPEGKDPMWTVMNEGGPYHIWNAYEDYLARLERTGRADGAALLREKYAHSPYNGEKRGRQP